jgi:tRNA-dihydrouridine synthase B
MFQVGSHVIDPPLVLAPMEDVTSLPARIIAKRIGNPGLVFTEFVSAMAIHHGALKTLKKMQIHPDERPLAIQIFGAEPDIMADTARIAEDMGADIVDINMGCWVPKVCKTGSGAALLKDPDNAERIVQSVVKAVNIPVTVKVRAGWDYSLFAAPDLAKRFQDAGAQMLTLHARFAKQGFEGEADWDLIKRLRESVTVPLIGNGDVKTPEDALKMMQDTGCDGVMVGRAAIANPWALGKISAAMRGVPEPSEPTLGERIRVALEHARLQVAYECEVSSYEEALRHPDHDMHEGRAVRSLRGQLPMYIKGFNGAAQVRSELYRASTVKELEDIFDQLALAS